MNGDSELRARFESLKRQDALSARPFAASWGDAVSRSRRGRRWLARLIPAVAAVVLTAVGAYLAGGRAPRPLSVVPISRWQSPTAVLLRTPGSQILSEMPRFGEPVIPSFKELRNP